MAAIDTYLLWILSCPEKHTWEKGLQELIVERIDLISDPEVWDRHTRELYANSGWYSYYIDSVSRKVRRPLPTENKLALGQWPPAEQLSQLIRTARSLKLDEEYEADVKMVLTLVAKCWIDELTPERVEDDGNTEG